MESRHEKGVLDRQFLKAKPEHVLAAARLGMEYAGQRAEPAVARYYVEMAPPTAENNVSDMGRLGHALK